MEEEEKGISIGEIFKIIFKRIWWVVAATAVAMIAFVCLVQFWYNPNKQSYSASFELRLPSGGSYPDGTTLRLSDSVLLENLQIIKDESLLPESKRTGKFADIDIEKMVEEDDIEFLQTIEQKEDETYEYHNTIKVTKKYFKNKEQAADFVRAVVEFPVTKSLYIVENINYYERLTRLDLDLYKSYSSIIDALVDQKNYVIGLYQGLSSMYGGTYVPEGLGSTRTLDEYIREFADFFDGTDQSALSNEISWNRYVYDTERYVQNVQNEINLANRTIEKNEELLKILVKERDELIGKLQGDYVKELSAYVDRIANLQVENFNLEYNNREKEKTLASILKYTEGEGKADKEAIDAQLLEIRNQLEEYTKEAVKVRIATYEAEAKAVYVNNKIEADGGLNIILAAAIGAVLGFVIAGAVIFIIDYPKYKREKQAAEAEAPAKISEQPESEEDA